MPTPDAPDLLDSLRAELAGRFEVERELGGGGMSRVFVALDPALGRRVVIKLLRPELAAALSVERFRREVELSAALQHPNIVPLLAADETRDHVPYFVMPFVDGESLRERLVRGPLSVRETVNVARDVVRALAFAHGRGIVHRDIKPGNILLSAGAAVVTDFGVAKAAAASVVGTRDTGHGNARQPSPASRHPTLTAMGTSLGTPAYMAPEQAAADPNVDFRADLYAFGVVLYEMLVGSPPFHGRTPQALLTAQMSETPPPIANRRYDVPITLAALVMHCLEKDPARRPRSAADVLRRLEEPTILSGAFATPPIVTRRRVSRALTVAVPALALVGALGIVWMRTAAPTTRASAPAADTTATRSAPAPAPLARSLAVLPLDAIGDDARARAIGDALAAQLATALATLPNLRVASRTGAETLRERKTMPAEIARTLGVTLLLEGSVQREGDRVRVTLRLVDAPVESTVWSRSFDGRVDDALALQDIAQSALVAAFDTARER